MMTDPREEDGIPVLSGDALAALQDFYNDRDAQQKRFEQLKAATEDASTTGGQRLSMDMFTEDWNASQFWYNDATATILARQLLSGATSSTHLAVVSAPSVFIQIKNLLLGVVDPPQVSLLEFDDRFAVLKEFVRYDFQQPMKLPQEMKGRFDRVICDPPFLSEDCQTKAAMTVRWLLKPSPYKRSDECTTKVIVCTGAVMETLIHKVYPGIQTTTFEPQHEQGRLSNEFRCYANFECDAWSWR